MPSKPAAPEPAIGQHGFTRVIVLQNPASTRAKQARKRIAELAKLAPNGEFELEVIETASSGRDANAALLRKLEGKLGPHTLLCIAAGDGTINAVLEALLGGTATLPAAVRQTPILPLWGGNANDLAHMLNGSGRGSIKKLLTKGKVVPVRPLRCTLTDNHGNSKVHLAACYASFGASAFATHRLSQPNRRHHPLDKLPGGRLLKELVVVLKALLDAPITQTAEQGELKNTYEHIFIKGSRFAKVRGARLRLTDEHFYHAVMRHKRARSLFFHIWELTSPRAVQRVAGDHAVFVPQERIWAQVDGEVFAVEAGTQITVDLSPQPVHLFSTLL